MVSERTGLTTDTIRAWERRYAAVTPKRSDARRRLYSDRDIERLRLLRKATEAGWRIGQVVDLPESEVRQIVADDSPNAEPEPFEIGPLPEGIAGEVLGEALVAVEALDQGALSVALLRALGDLGPRRAVLEVLAPLLSRVGDGWEKGQLRPAHEHLASAAVRSVVNIARPASAGAVGERNMATATLRGQMHEMGALLAACLASLDGWNVTYLGPNLPPEEIALVAYRRPIRVIAVGITYPLDDATVAGDLQRLGGLLPETVRLVVGGRAAASYDEVLQEIGAHRLALEEIPAALND